MPPIHDNLEEFADPPNYDVEEARSARVRIPYFCDLVARCGGPVLELACGSGLITLPIAGRCADVTGVDLCRPMLNHARQKAARLGVSVGWREGDARSVDLGRTFRLIVLTGNAFQAFLTPDDQDLLLRNVRRHLSSSGLFVFETRNPSAHDLRDQLNEQHWHEYRSVEGHAVRVSGTQSYDPFNQWMLWTTYRRWSTGSRTNERVTRITCRFTRPEELLDRLSRNGLAVAWQHGNWDGSPVAPESEHIITACRLQDDGATMIPTRRG